MCDLDESCICLVLINRPESNWWIQNDIQTLFMWINLKFGPTSMKLNWIQNQTQKRSWWRDSSGLHVHTLAVQAPFGPSLIIVTPFTLLSVGSNTMPIFMFIGLLLTIGLSLKKANIIKRPLNFMVVKTKGWTNLMSLILARSLSAKRCFHLSYF